MLNYDLHSHTMMSDGVLTPAELIDRAVTQNVDVIAITDHDTIEGIAPAQAYISQHQRPIVCVAGVELSTRWRGHEIHLVGLKFDPAHSDLQTLLVEQKDRRLQRAEKIAYRLESLGFAHALSEAQKYAQGDVVSRAHFARYLVQLGAVPSIEQAFRQYLGQRGRAYISPQWVALDEAITVIHEAGGIAVLAHPTRYRLSKTTVKKLISSFKASGGDAIEVSQSRQSLDELAFLIDMAQKHDLLASRGSDFHREGEYNELGKSTILPESLTPVWQDWDVIKGFRI